MNSLAQFGFGNDWIRFGDVAIHTDFGFVVDAKTGKDLRTFRNIVTGMIGVYKPASLNIPGTKAGKIAFPSLSTLILSALQGGNPYGDGRRGFAHHMDGNKWNPRPENLVWVSKEEFMQRRVMDNNVPLKLNGHLALTLTDIVEQLEEKGIKDLDAIGSVFRVSGPWVKKVAKDHKAWHYVKRYIDAIPTKAIDYQITKAKEAVRLYKERDKVLQEYMSMGNASYMSQ